MPLTRLVGVGGTVPFASIARLVAVVTHVNGNRGDGHDEGDHSEDVDAPTEATGEGALHCKAAQEKILRKEVCFELTKT